MLHDGDAAVELASQRDPHEETQTAHQRIVDNDLVMRTICGFVESDADLVNCMTASKGFFEAAVRHFYQYSDVKMFEILERKHCNVERLEIYKGHVRALTVWEHHDLPKNISARVQQYRALGRIAVWSNSFLAKGISAMEVYRIAGRRILIQSRTSPEDLDLSNRPGKVATGNDVEWLGIYGLYDAGRSPYESRAILERTLSTLGGGAASSLGGLRELGVLRATMSLEALETILRGCPSLKSLTCTFKTEEKSSLSDLGELLRTCGSGLHHLEAIVHGVEMLAFLPHLLVCPSLKLGGWTKAKTFLESDIPRPTTSPTRALVLAPNPLPGRDMLLPDPHQWSQRVKDIVPRACVITHEIEPGFEYTAQLWQKVVFGCFESLRELNRRRKTDRPGWTKRDRNGH